MPKPVTYPEAWGLTPLEAAYLTALRPGKIVSLEALTALHKAPVPAVRVRKTIGQLRRKLDPHDVEITTRWNEGWLLKRSARMRLTTLMKGARAHA